MMMKELTLEFVVSLLLFFIVDLNFTEENKSYTYIC